MAVEDMANCMNKILRNVMIRHTTYNQNAKYHYITKNILKYSIITYIKQ